MLSSWFCFSQNKKKASCHQQGLIENMTVEVTFQLVAKQLEMGLELKFDYG